MSTIPQNQSPELVAFQLLQTGQIVTENQLQVLENSCKDSGSRSSYLKLLTENPGNVWKSLNGLGNDGIRFILSLVDSEICANAVVSALKPELALSTPPETLILALNLSLNICLRYPNVKHLIFNSLLELLATSDKSVHGAATLSLMMSSKHNPTETSENVVKYLESELDRVPDEISNSAYLLILNTFETFFPVFPTQMKTLFTSDKCKKILLAKVALFTEKSPDIKLAEQVLRTTSLSCIDEETRKFVMENYLDFFIAGTKVQSSTIVALSLLCLIKIWNFTAIEEKISLQTVQEKVQTTLRNSEGEEEAVPYLLEALSYLSLGASVKQSLRDDEELCDRLLFILETDKESSHLYGALVVLLNLSEIKEKGSDQDTATVNYLKSVSLPSKNDSKDDETTIRLFNESLVKNHKLVSSLKALDLKKESLVTQAVQILYNLSSSGDRSIEREIVAQGGLTIVLRYLVDHSVIRKGTDRTEAFSSSEAVISTRRRALRALAAVCRSVNPKLMISEFDIKSTVPFLVELLGPSSADYSSQLQVSPDDPSAVLAESLTSLDKLCGLLALTNLSSLQEKDLTSIIIRRAFDNHLKDLMIDSTIPDIQRATWELINNLVSDPQMLAKFFNTENPESLKNLDILIKILHSRDVKLQEVIGGLLANATMEFGLVSLAILSEEANVFNRLLEIVASILQKQASNDDLILRVCSFFVNLVEIARSQKLPALEKIQNDQALKSGIKNVVVTTKNRDIMLTIREIIEIAQLKF